MIKEIKYNGYTATPSDYECPDGDLAGMMNVVPDNGDLKPVLPPTTLFTFDNKKKVAFIHETAKFKHYIIIDTTNNKMSWFDDGAKQSADTGVIPTTELKTFGSNTEVFQVNAIGNTLVAQCDNGMHYFLWKGDKEGYLYLGTHLPELPISFGLQGEMKRTDEFEITFDAISYETNTTTWNTLTSSTDPFCADFSDDNKSKVTSQVLAKVNKFIAENATNKGRFIFPFLVRYAYRLYDGSLTMHSSPVLMVCSSDVAPDVAMHRIWSNDHKYMGDHAKCRVVGIVHQLDYACIVQSRIDMLKNWKDIVRSVDVFISKPIYTYDQSGSCTSFLRTSDRDSFSICKLTNQTCDTTKYPIVYQKQKTSWAYCKAFNTWDNSLNAFTVYSYRVGLPRLTPDTVKANIKANSQFYFLKAIKIDDLKTTRTVIEVEDDYLQSLVARESMSDDYDSHDTMLSRYSFAYNQRLNITNIQKKLYAEYNTGALLPFTDGYVASYSNASPTVENTKKSYCVYFHIKQDGKDIVLQGETYALGNNTPVLFLYYPNTNCYKATILIWNVFGKYYEVSMETHNFLNGAVFMQDWEGALKEANYTTSYPSQSAEADRIIEVTNKIYTSDVNNPFRYAVTNINTVGTGRILGISTAAKALSEGQFGQFPLYAFTTEGVWALEVSTTTGSYSARQPITRDVIIKNADGTYNADCITQIDSAVLFATDRGIMLISGSKSQCISDILNGDEAFNPLSLPAGEKIITEAGFTTEQLNYKPFMEFLQGCGMLYDYTHQRIIVYNPKCRYAYVYSMKDKQWGMMPSNIADGVNSYPDALAMTNDGSLINLSTDNTSDGELLKGIRGLVFTRPFKLGAPDLLKTIDTIIQRGKFQRGHVQQVLYGSRDLTNWQLVWSSSDMYLRGFRGTPYKYFRLALLCQLDAEESLYGFTCQFNPRLINKPR